MNKLSMKHWALAGLVVGVVALMGDTAWHDVAPPNIEYISLALPGMALSGLSFLILMYFSRHRNVSWHRKQPEPHGGIVVPACRPPSCNMHYPPEVALMLHADMIKPDHLSHISHELRTPINAIMGFSKLLNDGRHGHLSEEQAELTDEIYSSCEHLLALINDILDMSKIEAGRMKLELKTLEIDMILTSCLSIFGKNYARQSNRLQLDFQPDMGDIRVDPRRVKQIVYNLLSNALKFSPPDRPVRLSARCVQRDKVGRLSGCWPILTFPLTNNKFNEFLEICVSDNGPGISTDEMAQLFQPFCQIENSATNNQEGTGLGLMLVKQLTELHGGTVALESARGQGSRFVVWLPLRTETEAKTMMDMFTVQQTATVTVSGSRKMDVWATPDMAQQGADSP